ncbi:hypothetical protein pipiens_010796 [Culex pipiens pipiens]|uniref:Uncharacterized protein n=1 Tax=Culex pipiens pipiens TaxID=38569 RepID=A0ABD1D8S7_CULPP
MTEPPETLQRREHFHCKRIAETVPVVSSIAQIERCTACVPRHHCRQRTKVVCLRSSPRRCRLKQNQPG